MQKKPIRALLAAFGTAVLLTAAMPPAYAQRTSELHARMEQLEERIARNVDRGRLSHRDARRMRGELQRVRESEDRMRADGRLDGRERQILDRRLDRLNAELSDARR